MRLRIVTLLPLSLLIGCVVGPIDGTSGAHAPLYADMDEDGFNLLDGDCDDSRASTYPGALETCNGIDDNCDGTTDEGTPDSGEPNDQPFDAVELGLVQVPTDWLNAGALWGSTDADWFRFTILDTDGDGSVDFGVSVDAQYGVQLEYLRAEGPDVPLHQAVNGRADVLVGVSWSGREAPPACDGYEMTIDPGGDTHPPSSSGSRGYPQSDHTLSP